MSNLALFHVFIAAVISTIVAFVTTIIAKGADMAKEDASRDSKEIYSLVSVILSIVSMAAMVFGITSFTIFSIGIVKLLLGV